MAIKVKTCRLSDEVKRVLETLSENQKQAIQKDYPFRRDRNKAICQLRARGVEVRVLVEITGISWHHIVRITKGSKVSGLDENERMSRVLEKLEKLLDILIKRKPSIKKTK